MNKKRCIIKTYDELKTEMEAIHQYIVTAKKNEQTDTIKKLRSLVLVL